MVERAKQYAKKYLGRDVSGHDWYHTKRVLHLAQTIARREMETSEVDLEMVELIALLHDVDDRKLSPRTHDNVDRAREFLYKNDVDPVRRKAILNSIRKLSFKGTGATVPETLEGRIVQDADRLDAMGAIGIARAFAFGGSRGKNIYDPKQDPNLNMTEELYNSGQSTAINHFYEKLLRLKDMMNTETGKAMAEHRHAYMESFLKEFYGEWEGKF